MFHFSFIGLFILQNLIKYIHHRSIIRRSVQHYSNLLWNVRFSAGSVHTVLICVVFYNNHTSGLINSFMGFAKCTQIIGIGIGNFLIWNIDNRLSNIGIVLSALHYLNAVLFPYSFSFMTWNWVSIDDLNRLQYLLLTDFLNSCTEHKWDIMLFGVLVIDDNTYSIYCKQKLIFASSHSWVSNVGLVSLNVNSLAFMHLQSSNPNPSLNRFYT